MTTDRIDPVAQLIADMQRASDLVDAADGPAEYQQRLVALALIARQYLRQALAARGSAPEHPAENTMDSTR